jgi:hypothetical protein
MMMMMMIMRKGRRWIGFWLNDGLVGEVVSGRSVGRSGRRGRFD